MKRKYSIYDRIDNYVPYKNIESQIQKEARYCFCYEDQKHCEKFTGPEVTLEAIPVMNQFEPDIMIRASRACGLILWFEASMYSIAQMSSPETIWYTIRRRIEKQCPGFVLPSPELPSPDKERHKKNRPRPNLFIRR